jgi:two-component system alkaline phosphatase synthesis response regulator PhoP
MTGTIYIIEDETDIADLIKYSLNLKGFKTQCYYSGEEGLRAIEKDKPDLIILDLMLPGMSGTKICQRLKENAQTKNIPIIMVTAKGEESDVAFGFEVGADDYVTKPFSPKILIARVTAVLKRSKTPTKTETDILDIGNLSLHPGRHEVLVNGEKVDLTKSEFQILQKLARKPGWVFTRAQIVEAIHGDNFAVTDRAIDFQMVGLRKKLGEMGNYLETVRGVGYRFKEI